MRKRKLLRLKNYDYSEPGFYFVTICTKEREHVFGYIVDGEMKLNELGEIVRDEWLKTSNIRSNVKLNEFVVMPNHFHGILQLTDVGATRRVAPTHEFVYGLVSGSIGVIIGQFKSVVTKQINKSRNTPAKPVWQRNYYERVIRNEHELHEIRQYIVNNPLKWDLDPENQINIDV